MYSQGTIAYNLLGNSRTDGSGTVTNSKSGLIEYVDYVLSKSKNNFTNNQRPLQTQSILSPEKIIHSRNTSEGVFQTLNNYRRAEMKNRYLSPQKNGSTQYVNSNASLLLPQPTSTQNTPFTTQLPPPPANITTQFKIIPIKSTISPTSTLATSQKSVTQGISFAANNSEKFLNDQIFNENQINEKMTRFEDRYKGYIILRQLGGGKYSKVYLAKHIESNLHVALKVLQKSTLLSENMMQQLVWEIKIQYLLRHPNIVKLYTFFKTDTEIILVLEYCPDGTLLQLIRSQPDLQLPEKLAKVYTRQITQALAFLHQNDVIHRDIKPDNILLSYGQAKLADFSFCVYSPSQYRQTQCGTLMYSSPEVMQGQLYDTKSDIWGLGILCYELNFGETPWSDLRREEQMEKIKQGSLIIPSETYNSTTSKQLKDFIECLVKKDQSERFNARQALSHPWMKEPVSEITPYYIKMNEKIFR